MAQIIQGPGVICYYCSEYGKIYSDYPQNEGETKFNDLTPRCKFHGQYTCDTCKREIHFNGISWCSSCGKLTCIKCGPPRIKRVEYFFYDYYYEIPCSNCNQYHPALDYAEFNMGHPYLNGDLKPDFIINIWLNMGQDPTITDLGSGWGSSRIKQLSVVQFERLDNLREHHPEKTWNENADMWGGNWPEGGDFNHKYIIIPEVIRLLDLGEKSNSVLDVACGEGTVSRELARKGNTVIGIDLSENMLSYAINREEDEKLGIKYVNMNAEDLDNEFSAGSFDRIVCNMAIMDIANHKKVFEKVEKLLKPGGIFVFSITHPSFTWPITHSLKLPRDSERNEDKIWIVGAMNNSYFDNRPTTVKFGDLPSPLLYFPRTMSEYINSLISAGLVLLEISEPEVDRDLMDQFPREFHNDYDRIPNFMIFKLSKK